MIETTLSTPFTTNGDSAPGIDLRPWREAEHNLGRMVTAASVAAARLDERIATHPERDALIQRLALREICDLSWADGADIPIERLALYRASGTGGGEAAARDLLRADWGIRRLTLPDTAFMDPGALITFLGLKLNDSADDALMDLIDRTLGRFFMRELEAWLGLLDTAADLHPFTRAAIGYQFWRLLELARSADLMEPAVIAAKLAARDNDALPFIPFATGNRRALQNLSPYPEPRLEAWLGRITAACETARREIIAVDEWQGRAAAATSGMSGKTPARLLDALITHPVVSARMLVDQGKVSLPSAGRALTAFETLGLTTEVTGAGRFRYWRIR